MGLKHPRRAGFMCVFLEQDGHAQRGHAGAGVREEDQLRALRQAEDGVGKQGFFATLAPCQDRSRDQ